MTESGRTGGFSERVVVLFAASVLTAGIGMFNAFLFARLLGPEAKGEYYLLVLLPNTVLVLLQLGLPAALGFYAARGRTTGIIRRALTLAISLSAPALVVIFAVFPLLQGSLLRGVDPLLLAVTLCVIPVLVIATFTSSIVIALKSVRWYAAVNIAQSAASTVLLVVVIGLMGYRVEGAIALYLAIATLGMVGLVSGAVRAVRRTPAGPAVTYRELLRYGLPLFPGSLTTFFSSRADIFLIAAMVPDPSAALGYYSMAVTLAEMATYLPSAVSSVFLPHVAGSQRKDADRQVTTVARATILLTGAFAIALAPVGTILISIALPAFTPALPAFYVLLPAVVSLALARVVGEYVSGLGRTGLTSAATILGFIVNLVANVILIPQLGIVGASAASLISYTATALAITLIAARLARAPLPDFWIPRVADARFVGTAAAALVRQAVSRRRAPRNVRPDVVIGRFGTIPPPDERRTRSVVVPSRRATRALEPRVGRAGGGCGLSTTTHRSPTRPRERVTSRSPRSSWGAGTL